MRALVQRVASASVAVDGEVIGSIGDGLCALIGVTHTDGHEESARLADKLWNLRILPDTANPDGGSIERSLADRSAVSAPAEILVVSQFTLYGDASRGRRPSWTAAAPPAQAAPLVEAVVATLRSLGGTVATGRFGAHMRVSLANDGPVTLMLEVNRKT